jgi:hypothetical protein
MIRASMSRAAKGFLALTALLGIAAIASGCGEQTIALSKNNPLYPGALLFNQRCSGCHTLSYAATHGSATNVHTAQFNNGPNFNVRCERTANGAGVERVLYAIENGGFSGAIMPQNVVVGQQAIEVAKFVATYAGRQAPPIPGVTPCDKLPVGSVPTLATASTGTRAYSLTESLRVISSVASKHTKAAKAKHKP